MANSQNTVAGTSDGNPIVATNGSSFMDYLTQLSDIGSKIGSQYVDFYLSKKSAEIVEKNTVSKPQQTVPDYLISNPADFFSDPARVQRTFLFISLGALLLASTIYLIKKK